MNKLILTALLILAPYTLFPIKQRRMKQPIKRHTRRTIAREVNIGRAARRAICNPQTVGIAITVGSAVFVSILKATTTILTLFLR